MTTVTSNGDIAHVSMGSPILDFFAGVCRSTAETRISELIPLCWAEDPLLTMKLLFYKRDCRGGAGERRIFELGFGWVLTHHPDVALRNMPHLIEYGSFKDIAKLMEFPAARDRAAEIFAENLNTETLAAKWAPSLGSALDRKFGCACAIARSLKLGRNWQQQYRRLLGGLRDHLAVVESLMSAGKWEAIDFSKVPSLAMQRYKKAFERHTPDQWDIYLLNCIKGTAKVNAKQLMPHEIIRGNLYDPLTQIQWDAMVADVRSKGVLNNAVAMCDVSGSMIGLPMDVSIAIGCLVSEVSETNKDELISFTDQPRFFNLTNMSLKQRVDAIKVKVGYNTDVAAAFRAILTRATSQAQIPEKIIIISDMHFDQADPSFGENSFQAIKACYTDAGYTLPQIIYWNVTGSASVFPVMKQETGTCMVSGFNQNILNSVLKCEITNPLDVMLQILNSPRYDRISS